MKTLLSTALLLITLIVMASCNIVPRSVMLRRGSNEIKGSKTSPEARGAMGKRLLRNEDNEFVRSLNKYRGVANAALTRKPIVRDKKSLTFGLKRRRQFAPPIAPKTHPSTLGKDDFIIRKGTEMQLMNESEEAENKENLSEEVIKPLNVEALQESQVTVATTTDKPLGVKKEQAAKTSTLENQKSDLDWTRPPCYPECQHGSYLNEFEEDSPEYIIDDPEFNHYSPPMTSWDLHGFQPAESIPPPSSHWDDFHDYQEENPGYLEWSEEHHFDDVSPHWWNDEINRNSKPSWKIDEEKRQNRKKPLDKKTTLSPIVPTIPVTMTTIQATASADNTETTASPYAQTKDPTWKKIEDLLEEHKSKVTKDGNPNSQPKLSKMLGQIMQSYGPILHSIINKQQT